MNAPAAQLTLFCFFDTNYLCLKGKFCTYSQSGNKRRGMCALVLLNIFTEKNASADCESNNRTHANLGLFPNRTFEKKEL